MKDRVDVERLDLSRLAPWKRNPRRIAPEAREGLRASLTRFGLVEPVVVNRRGRRLEVVAGHQRLELLREAGVRRARCVVVSLPAKEARALAVTLNSREIQGEFTEGVLAVIEEMRAHLGADLAAALRLEELRRELPARELEGRTLPDDIPEPRRKAVAKPGELWTLGEHRLLCGDARNAKHVARLMNGERAGLFATDPPYLIDYDGTNRPLNRQKKGGGKDWSAHYREKEIKDPEAFLREFLAAGLAAAEPHAAVYVWHSHRRYSLLERVAVELGLLPHQQIIWAKPAALLTRSYYSWQHEPCLMLWRKGHKPPLDRRQSKPTVWVVGLERPGDPTQPEYYTDLWPLD